MYSCAVIGHKPTRFRFKYNENESRCKRLKRRLRDQFVLLYGQGVRRFLLGGALGVDIWSGEILLQLKEQPEYSGIELVLVLPHPEHDVRWDKRSRARMAALIAHCTKQITVSAVPGPESYYKRNRYQADHADCLIAVYDGNSSVPSGTGKTIEYAAKKSIPIICIDPDKGIVSEIKAQ